ncbi:MAG TPA: inositol monophosphatase family protein [Candidatus Thermoplasmatota archaeon]|nr:inositol monophosphatase family protein [Candidatus Thermoplasmatota archaeon]
METPLVRIALKVREAVQASDRSKWGETVEMGADGTPTKWVDDLAEKVLLQELDREGVDANVLSEEAGFVDREGRQLLVADPIDGTHNAVRGIPFYCISLALARDRLHDVSEGVVVNALSGDVYHARKGKGATLNGRPVKAREWRERFDTVSVYIGPEAPEAAFELTRFPRRVRGLGAAALEIALVGAGALDAYVQWGNPLRCTDVAAAALILREAGGEIYDYAGAVLDMPLNSSARRDVTATGSPALASIIHEHVRASRAAEADRMGHRVRRASA